MYYTERPVSSDGSCDFSSSSDLEAGRTRSMAHTILSSAFVCVENGRNMENRKYERQIESGYSSCSEEWKAYLARTVQSTHDSDEKLMYP